MSKNLDLLKKSVSKNVFSPTGTSDILIEVAKKVVKPKTEVLDLGCGNGIIGISICLFHKKKIKIYFSDISSAACKNTEINCNKFKIINKIKKGKILSPWKGYNFDYIVSDIAAIADPVAKISPWYKNCINNAGKDGTKNVLGFLEKAPLYLKKNGAIVMPIISLSREKKIISLLKKNFRNIKKLKSQIWPLPRSMYKYKNLLTKLKKKNIIYFEDKFGILTFKTHIYYAKKK